MSILKIVMPSEPPGEVIELKVTDSTYSTLSLGWTKPTEEEGVQDEAKGYFVELRPAENPEWGRCNSNAIMLSSYTIMGLKSMAMYWVRVLATNEGGEGEPRELNNYIIAMPPAGESVEIENCLQSEFDTFSLLCNSFPHTVTVRPQFTDKNMKNFMVIKAGDSARVNFNFKVQYNIHTKS